MEPLKVLIVDDEPGIRSGIERVLNGFSVSFPFLDTDFTFDLISVETGEEAVQHIDNSNIDIVLLDNKLPGIQGIEVLEYINKSQIDVEVMMITSYANLDLAVRATSQGAFNFVPKPFTPQELRTAMEAITKHLYLRSMGKNLNANEKQTRFQFLSVLSHELKSPINAIEGYLNIMFEKQLGDDINDYANMVERSLIRIKGMRGLIMDMLDITRLESGIKRREIKPLDLVEIAKISKDTVSPLAIQKNIMIYLEAPEELIFKGDYNEIEIVFNNLLSNAVKYNKDNGKVFFRIINNNSEIEIVVEDTGIGIDENDLPKLFGEFERIKNAKTRDITGTGLGLNIVKKIIDMYSGTIRVISIPDKGTKFTICLAVK